MELLFEELCWDSEEHEILRSFLLREKAQIEAAFNDGLKVKERGKSFEMDFGASYYSRTYFRKGD